MKAIEFKENTAYHAETEYEANWILKHAHDQGYRWPNGGSFLRTNKFDEYGSGTCYSVLNGLYDDLGWYESINYSVVKVKELMKEHMTDKEKAKKELEELKREFKERTDKLEEIINKPDGHIIPSWQESIMELKKGYYIDACSNLCSLSSFNANCDKPNNYNLCISEEFVNRHHAEAQLSIIWREIVRLNCPGQLDIINQNACIKFYIVRGIELYVECLGSLKPNPFALPTEELAQAFLDKHRGLWEQYYMID